MKVSDPAGHFAGEIRVPFERIATFVRQVTHDVRNGLNAIDLQAAYVLELETNPDSAEELKRLRGQIQQSARSLQALSANFWIPQISPVDYEAKIFVEDFRDRLAKLFPERAPELEWKLRVGGQTISVDIEMIFNALAEIIRNAFQFGDSARKIEVHAFADGNRFVFEVRQGMDSAPVDAGNWGVEPFVSTRRGGYGLGLFRSRMVLAAHGGDICFSHEPARAVLTSRVSLPFAP